MEKLLLSALIRGWIDDLQAAYGEVNDSLEGERGTAGLIVGGMTLSSAGLGPLVALGPLYDTIERMEDFLNRLEGSD